MKKLLLALAVVFSVFALTQNASAQGYPGNGGGHGGGHGGGNGNGNGGYAREYITCESHSYNYNECRSFEVRRIERARLVRQHSKTACRQGRNWGATQRSVWVDQGCRATFEVMGRR